MHDPNRVTPEAALAGALSVALVLIPILTPDSMQERAHLEIGEPSDFLAANAVCAMSGSDDNVRVISSFEGYSFL
jgi:hypothetical protein